MNLYFMYMMTIWIIVLAIAHFPSGLVASAHRLILHSSLTASTDYDALDVVSLMNSSGGYVVVSLLSID
jgi:hypothetical protein